MKIATFVSGKNLLLTGPAARLAWKNQHAKCACNGAGSAHIDHTVHGTAAGLDAIWLGCEYCTGSAVGFPLVMRSAGQIAAKKKELATA